MYANHGEFWEERVYRGFTQSCQGLVKIETSSAVAEMGDCGYNRHEAKRGRGAVPLSKSAGNPSNTMWPARRSTSVPSGVFIHPVFGHDSVGCHSLRRNISTNYYFVVEMHTVTVRSDDAQYLLKNSTNCLV